ncbi:unnamed protein product [Phytophthora fragariaefolia]|uniref:Unnamed protein product n=1 Tax=Phytophthora fragariaefolia TaxID=1490495 RepID=A0A9W7DFJ3_9STRA|nr:unnamed protein product [Phytophthora fragariaefolia]
MSSLMNNLDLILMEGGNVDVVSTFIKSESDTTRSGLTTGSSDSNLPSPQTRNAPQKPKRKRKAKPGYSTEHDRRKKAEILALRSQVLRLENGSRTWKSDHSATNKCNLSL